MEQISTKEFEPMQLVITVTSELGHGYGKISAANRYTDEEAQAAAEEMRKFVEPVEEGTPSGCIDGRGVLRLLNDQESKLGPKTAGGSAITGLAAMELDDAFGDNGSPYEHLARVINILEDDGKVPARFHVDADHADKIEGLILKSRAELAEVRTFDDFLKKIETLDIDATGSGCGMDDQLLGAISCMADTPRQYKDLDGNEQTETDDMVADRLKFMKTTSAAVQGDGYNEQRFDRHAQRATGVAEAYKNWNSLKALLVADRALNDLGVEDGVLGRLEVLETSDRGVHGHVEDFIDVFKVAGVTLNQTKYYQETGKQAFTYDQWISDKIANAAAASLTDIQERFDGIKQAVTEANLAGAFQLTNGSQRAIIYS